MRIPRLQISFVRLVGAMIFALAGTLHAETPPNSSETRAVKTQRARTRPQVIYHVRPASNYAATLHSQEKTETNELPVDRGTAPSPQVPRENPNPPAVGAMPRPEAMPKQRPGTRPKAQKKQMARPPMSVKSKGHGHSGKGHKH